MSYLYGIGNLHLFATIPTPTSHVIGFWFLHIVDICTKHLCRWIHWLLNLMYAIFMNLFTVSNSRFYILLICCIILVDTDLFKNLLFFFRWWLGSI